MNLERTSTAIVFFGSTLFLFWILPQQVEVVDYGRVLPSTVPSISLWVIIVCSGLQFFAKIEAARWSGYAVVRTLLFFLAIVFAVYLMSFLGFEYCAPVLALFVMLMIGERRWYWLVSGSLLVPLGAWLLVEQVLGRQLP